MGQGVRMRFLGGGGTTQRFWKSDAAFKGEIVGGLGVDSSGGRLVAGATCTCEHRDRNKL